ncbi:hypothetical protein [Plantactinospora endophytica]|uniref:Uncharacterized protein n=1 Tax=Plantactinospora endophytica TaxID=673535 RepID=A0ABQ4EEE7_9ACTN|nr:hypothetical protein [Plantactinospora endophytica]GIG93100.1 hypothetical protein Pen02_80360 [Plantactinospora endophytica]
MDEALTDGAPALRHHRYIAGWPEVGVLVGSLLLIAVGFLWWGHPSSYPFGPQDRFADLSLMTFVPPDAAVALALSAGAVGLALAGLLLSGRAGAPIRVGGIAVAAVAATMLGFLVPDIQVLTITAYLMTLAVPAVIVAALTTRLFRLARPDNDSAAGACGIAVGAAAFITLLLWLSYIARDAEPIGYRPLVVFGSLAVGACWAAVLVRLLRHHRGHCQFCGRPGAPWTTPASAASWGRILTWSAALCPLPYVLTRLSWLTPWPIGESAETLAEHPGLRLFGLALAVAGEGGTWLTLGLIRPRGEVFPRSLPFLGGRPVPVYAAVIPGSVVSLMMCIAGHSLVQQSFGAGSDLSDHLLVLLMPFPLWGPLLAAAVLAYWYRRRPECRVCAHATTQQSADGQRSRSSGSGLWRRRGLQSGLESLHARLWSA